MQDRIGSRKRKYLQVSKDIEAAAQILQQSPTQKVIEKVYPPSVPDNPQ